MERFDITNTHGREKLCCERGRPEDSKSGMCAGEVLAHTLRRRSMEKRVQLLEHE